MNSSAPPVLYTTVTRSRYIWLVCQRRLRRLCASLCRRWFFASGVLAVILFLLILIPYDSQLRLFYRYHFVTKSPPAQIRKQWLQDHTHYPLYWAEDVGIILKSGFGTQYRIPAWFDAAQEVGDIVITADYATDVLRPITHEGRHFPVYDVVDAMIQQEFGWELDAMKFISSLQLAYHKMPHKKWYLLVDDDTYVLQVTMELLLSHLDPSKPHYIGNPVGGYLGRFAHGGSAVVLSHAAIKHLFAHPRIVSQAFRDSLSDPYGDHLLSATLMKVGIYIEEEYTQFFNGERPVITKIRADRLCAPIASFHGLRLPEEMRSTGETFRGVKWPITWLHVWSLFNAPALRSFETEPMRENWDHVGRTDEHTRSLENVQSASDCLALCRSWTECLAWTWDADKERATGGFTF
ncbi:hypothetical protein CMQ_8046 [Grosmannia clavigera kw1407]|uniref:N-acetylgalactosaminide beta-1,3-galactosyltransferase n=1 Tax=Grosmannia clavigera (strain kw1407 / UAMH 11150) TaxID=655863 RepID=F0XKN5_GROCL|nr:uncharacterized protein CMQ_8046 [Grosmannia clavigera kw1407]EFX01580.1 hypothetical protein CMQ_8046 [Grosmannia clavigera kw1407]